jgi:hypothetical protein
MKREPLNPTARVEGLNRNLVSLATLEAAAALMETPERRYRVAIVNCDSTSLAKQAEVQILEYAAVRG